jgi:hypothetical protein
LQIFLIFQFSILCNRFLQLLLDLRLRFRGFLQLLL